VTLLSGVRDDRRADSGFSFLFLPSRQPFPGMVISERRQPFPAHVERPETTVANPYLPIVSWSPFSSAISERTASTRCDVVDVLVLRSPLVAPYGVRVVERRMLPDETKTDVFTDFVLHVESKLRYALRRRARVPNPTVSPGRVSG
jgi:hypothetical protein